MCVCVCARTCSPGVTATNNASFTSLYVTAAVNVSTPLTLTCAWLNGQLLSANTSSVVVVVPPFNGALKTVALLTSTDESDTVMMVSYAVDPLLLMVPSPPHTHTPWMGSVRM